MQALSDDELRAKTDEFRQRLAAGRDARRPPARGVRRLPRGRPPLPQDAALRRPAHGRHGPARRQHRRDGHRRGQDARRHPGRLPQRARGQGRPRRHRQRLPRPPRRRVDEPALQRPGHDRRRHPVRHGLRGAAADLRLRHHLRHQQRVRLRLPPRQHEADQGVAGAGRAPLRDHRRGRQHPDRRGPDPADHLRPGLRRRPQVRRGRPDRPPAPEGRPLRGQGEGADLPPQRRGHPRGRADRRDRELLHPRQHGVAPPDRQRPEGPPPLQAGTATTSSSTARSSSSTSSPAAS